MDRIKEASALIVQLNKYIDHQIKNTDFIKAVCKYFDNIKDNSLNEYDLYFLKYISDKSGIPMYFNMLKRFNFDLSISNINLQVFSSILYESTLYTDSQINIHKYQKEILDLFISTKKNRYLLTASTSFGKTFLVYEIIRKMKYKNILLIFPSIALLSENLEKIISNNDYSFIKEKYSIFTLSEIDSLGENNIFIYTPERYLSFLEKNDINFDFIFIDEIYKIDNEFEINEENRENERDTAYRLASLFAAKKQCDILFAGPYINVKQNSLSCFLKENNIIHLNYNDYEIVSKNLYKKVKNKYINENSGRFIELPKKVNKSIEVQTIVNSILENKENVIVYCSQKGKNYGVEYYANLLASASKFEINDNEFTIFLNHLKKAYSEDWIVYKSLIKGIGIHHGLIPKYIQKEIINFFNRKIISVLISTTTITEGVNTAAKNLIVTLDKKGEKDLLPFDAKNIAGRAGRLGYHYSGNVFDLTKGFTRILENESKPLKYINYDKDSDKNDIDIFYTDKQYLTRNDFSKQQKILLMQKEKQIPTAIFDMYKMISRADKISIFDRINVLERNQRRSLDECITQNYRNYKFLNLQGGQIILDILTPIIKQSSLQTLITLKDKNNRYSILLYLMKNYLDKGLKGLIDYYKTNESYDSAMNKSAKFVFNTLKYQVVKYLGVFNLIYKFIISKERNIPFEEVHGLDRMLRYFEYNAISDIGRKISDYGVPSKLLSYYEENDNLRKKKIINNFDAYEKKIFEKTQNIFK